MHVDICLSRSSLKLCLDSATTVLQYLRLGVTPGSGKLDLILRQHQFSTRSANSSAISGAPLRRHCRVHLHAPTQSKVEGDPDLARKLQEEGERGLRIFGYEPERSLRASRAVSYTHLTLPTTPYV